ncbi:glycosyltransferase family 2 protein [Candidatus Stoquefichus massiliensis]|uniref:glycosyltransferase family 2 protein n=1 Tax=Candidatus Stoquefichus massiliensis TaxID=1470350 RepID=UPI000481E1C1|nr:glycosyltransferase family 2 protein [Candidatus Stoquefichus massiliensis]
MEENLVSIITPAYNAGKTIREAIESVLNQTYQNWELLIVDDCSTDNTYEIINEFEDLRIRVFRHEKNMGAAIAWNTAFKHMQGRYVAFIDADDIWTDNKLSLQLRYMKKNNYEFTYTSYDWIDDNGLSLNKIIKAPKTQTYESFLKNTNMGNSTVIMDRKYINILPVQKVDMNWDGALRFPILKQGHTAHGMDEVCMHYRVNNNSVSSNKIKAAKGLWNLYKNILNIPFFPRCYYFGWYVFNSLKRYYLNI